MLIASLLLSSSPAPPPQTMSLTIQDHGVLRGSTIGQILSKAGFPIGRPSPDVQLFALTYPSRDYAGRSTSLSGLVAIPRGRSSPKGWVLYFHSTTTQKSMVPSRLEGDAGPTEAQLVVAAFASAGYAVLAPDYLGLGDSLDVHPYALPSVNCRAGLDMLSPVADLATRQGWSVPPRVFVTGYSEGGAVAMWAAKSWTPAVGMKLVAAAPMSGAYDMSGVELPAILSGQSNVKWLGARIFLAGYLGYTFSKLVPDVPLDRLFVPSFASYLPLVFKRDKTDDAVAQDLAIKGLRLGAIRTIKRILQPEMVRALEARDGSNRLVRALSAEDCFDWAPVVPLDLVCLANDFLVPADNAKEAQKAMTRHQASGKVQLDEFTEPGYDHLSFIPKAIEMARQFFDRQVS